MCFQKRSRVEQRSKEKKRSEAKSEANDADAGRAEAVQRGQVQEVLDKRQAVPLREESGA